MTTLKNICLEKEKDFYQITLNRPEKRNALDSLFMDEFIATLGELRENLNSCKFLLLKGAGKSFCAGADLNWMKSMVHYSLEENKEDSLKLFNLFWSLYTFPLPVVTVAQGHVYGGGLWFLAASDFVLADKDTKFCFSEVKLGLAPSVISSFVLSKCSPSLAAAHMTSGKEFSYSMAFHMGLVHGPFSPENLQSLLDDYKKGTQEALVECKKLIHMQSPLSPEKMKDQTIESISKLRVSQKAQQRMKNFLEKINTSKS